MRTQRSSGLDISLRHGDPLLLQEEPLPVDCRQAEPIDAAHQAAVEEGRAQARLGQFATDEAMAALFRRAGL